MGFARSLVAAALRQANNEVNLALEILRVKGAGQAEAESSAAEASDDDEEQMQLIADEVCADCDGVGSLTV